MADRPIKKSINKALKSQRPQGGIERSFPAGMSTSRKVASRILSMVHLDPIIEAQGIATSSAHGGHYIGQKIVRASGMTETKRSIPVVLSAEAPRFAFSTLQASGLASESLDDEDNSNQATS